MDRPSDRPWIGIACYRLGEGRVPGWTVSSHALPDPYVAAVARAGGRPVLLPACDLDDPAGALSRCDGLILAGGGDVDPARYDAQRGAHVYGVDAVRDAAELALAAWAVESGLPLLAICRGHQVLNVALGGTLVQHLDDIAGLIPHGDIAVAGGPGSALHDVAVTPATRLAAIAGASRDCGASMIGASMIGACASHHHQAVDVLGAGLVVSGRSADGVVEAIEPADPRAGWILGVQWHPERTAHGDPAQQALFGALVVASH